MPVFKKTSGYIYTSSQAINPQMIGSFTKLKPPLMPFSSSSDNSDSDSFASKSWLRLADA
ncbi:hypothetical protein [aff. Roholtiella sp. LEGE 12411]|uniref:hypothetical protein n=1 Tax=aff. Roholtiella sp. LEGE 12411 TaxID=1828822 RepID=UPI0018815CC1|nr:hypothetical protein [aff. Roholtiella sp. LEGE 12411]